MRANGGQWGWVIGFLLMCVSVVGAQDESAVIAPLDRLPVWHLVESPAEPTGRPAKRWVKIRQDNTYANLDDLVRLLRAGHRIESLVLSGPALAQNACTLGPLLSGVRVLTLSELTVGQADSLLSQMGRGTRLERLTIDITHSGSGRAVTNQSLILPAALRRFSKLSDVRIREYNLNWIESVPVLAGMSALRRLSIDRYQSRPRADQQPVLNTLRQLRALSVAGYGWLIGPKTVSGLDQLNSLTLSGMPVKTDSLQAVLNRLPTLETFRMTKCWQVQTLSFGALKHLKTVFLDYNDKIVVDSAMLAGMTHLEQFTYKGGQPIDLTGLGKLAHLRYLNVMGGGQTARLPDDMSGLTHLTDLRLYTVKIRSLPGSFGVLRRLQTLHLNQCSLDSLPATFGRLTALRDLTLSGNRLRKLPGIGQLKNLRQLTISGTSLTTLPTGIEKLTKLTRLNIPENQFTELPASISRLTHLTALWADHNRLERLPKTIGQLTRLTSISVGGNRLTKLPASLTQLNSLTSISAGYNQLDSLPANFGELHKLSLLSLSNNRLTALPATMDQLDSLRYLWLDDNLLSTLPAAVGRLHNLGELMLDGNPLTTLPADLADLQKLTVLSLDKLPLTELSASVGALASLQVLSLTNTPLRTLPDSIGTLVNLRTVRLTNNQLTTLPSSIGGWRSVTTLDLSGNPLELLPNGIGRMTNLTELIINGKATDSTGRNRGLLQLPDSIIHCDQLHTLTIDNQPRLDADQVFRKAAQLKNLTKLSVVNGNIAQLPDLDWKTVPWQTLNLTSNRLTDLPVALLDAPRLWYIIAGGNRLPDPLNRTLHGRQGLLSAFAEAGRPLPTLYTKPSRSLAELLQQTAYNDRQLQANPAGMLRALSRAIEYAPDTVRSSFYAGRANFYLHQKNYTQALADYDSAIYYVPWLQYEKLAFRPDTSDTRVTLLEHKSHVFNAMKQYTMALAVLEQARQIKPVKNEWLTARIEVERGRNLTALNQLAGADSSYRRAIYLYEKLNHGSVGPDLWVAELSLMIGDYDRAKQLIRRMPTEPMKNGYDTWKVYLNLCVTILDGVQSGQQATEGLKTYMANFPEMVYSRLPDLFENWFVHSQLPTGKKQALQQLSNTLREQQNRFSNGY